MNYIPRELRPFVAKLEKALSEAVNDGVGESDAVADALTEIRRRGYASILAMNIVIGLHKLADIELQAPPDEAVSLNEVQEDTASQEFVEQGGDRAFLRQMHVTFGDRDPS